MKQMLVSNFFFWFRKKPQCFWFTLETLQLSVQWNVEIVWRQGFDCKITVLSQATFLVIKQLMSQNGVSKCDFKMYDMYNSAHHTVDNFSIAKLSLTTNFSQSHLNSSCIICPSSHCVIYKKVTRCEYKIFEWLSVS